MKYITKFQAYTVFFRAYVDVGHKLNCSFSNKIQEKTLKYPMRRISLFSINDYYSESMTDD